MESSSQIKWDVSLFKFDIPEPWRKVLAELKKEEGVVIVLGASDTGKTTFCRWLVEEISRAGQKVAWVDGDIGQSTIGPPTTVGMAIFQKGSPNPFEEVKPLFMRFVGSTSPVGHLLQTLVGVKKMVDKSFQLGADSVIVDTTGLVAGDIGRELKFQKIDLIGPRYILALERKGELEDLLTPYISQNETKVCRLPVSANIRLKSASERQRNRELRNKCYFQNAKIMKLSFKNMGLHGMVPSLNEKKDLNGLLIGLCDQWNDTLALGIIGEIDIGKKLLSILTPISDLGKVRSIQFGSIRLDREGRELGKRFFGV